MKSVRTSTRRWVRICGLVLALGLWLSGLGSANAEPSAECRALAVRFGAAAYELDAGALAGLIACVSVELQDRTGGPALAPPPPPPPPPAVVVPPSPPPAPIPPPAPPEPSGRISSFRQTWPQSAPWGGDWPNAGMGGD
jgi:outer membrane biosynthesis protein TonB